MKEMERKEKREKERSRQPTSHRLFRAYCFMVDTLAGGELANDNVRSKRRPRLTVGLVNRIARGV